MKCKFLTQNGNCSLVNHLVADNMHFERDDNGKMWRTTSKYIIDCRCRPEICTHPVNPLKNFDDTRIEE